jgi:hypothetical protein
MSRASSGGGFINTMKARFAPKVLPKTPFREVLPTVVPTANANNANRQNKSNTTVESVAKLTSAIASLLRERERLKAGYYDYWNNTVHQNNNTASTNTRMNAWDGDVDRNWIALKTSLLELNERLKGVSANPAGLATLRRATAEFAQLDLSRLGKDMYVRDLYDDDAFPDNDLVVNFERIVMDWETGFRVMPDKYKLTNAKNVRQNATSGPQQNAKQGARPGVQKNVGAQQNVKQNARPTGQQTTRLGRLQPLQPNSNSNNNGRVRK